MSQYDLVLFRYAKIQLIVFQCTGRELLLYLAIVIVAYAMLGLVPTTKYTSAPITPLYCLLAMYSCSSFVIFSLIFKSMDRSTGVTTSLMTCNSCYSRMFLM